MQSMRASMDGMPEKERGEWERGERGNWGVICGMMNRAMGSLADARRGGEGIVCISVLVGIEEWVSGGGR